VSLTILDPVEASRARRRIRRQSDRFTECWNGRVVVPPMPNTEHAQLQLLLAAPFHDVVVRPGLGVAMVATNVSDRADGWDKNYRGPDLLVYLNENPAVDHGTHWQGGPDFLVEILSRGERPRAKFRFYAAINTRQVLLVHRRKAGWALELFQLREGKLEPAGRSTPDAPDVLGSGVLPLTFQLVPGPDRPRIRVAHPTDGREWLA
jgi:Uma2 family endonuclease